MSESMSVIAFMFSQVVFLPSYIKCTQLLIGNQKFRVSELIKYIMLSPLSAYILSSAAYFLIGRNVPEIAAIGADMIMYLISMLFVIFYQHLISENGNRVLGIYIYVSFFVFQSSFTYVFENACFILFDQIILTSILSITIYEITAKYIGVINQKNLELTSENKMMLIIPFSASIIKLIQSVTYSVMTYGNVYNAIWLDKFSAYNAVISNIILVMTVCFTGMMFHAILRQTQSAEDACRYKKLSEQSLHAMARAIEAKDVYTNGHSIRVAKYTEMIAKKLGYNDNDAKTLYMMALMHDVGKIGIADTIINKATKLTKEEYNEVKRHPEIGAEILREVDAFGEMSEIALDHHERVDGKGYPRGLKGDEISDEVAIVSVADAYDSMTSRRSYRDVMPQDVVYKEIKNGIDKQFRREPAEAMLEIIASDTTYELRQHF